MLPAKRVGVGELWQLLIESTHDDDDIAVNGHVPPSKKPANRGKGVQGLWWSK